MLYGLYNMTEENKGKELNDGAEDISRLKILLNEVPFAYVEAKKLAGGKKCDDAVLTQTLKKDGRLLARENWQGRLTFSDPISSCAAIPTALYSTVWCGIISTALSLTMITGGYINTVRVPMTLNAGFIITKMREFCFLIHIIRHRWARRRGR